MNSSYTAQVTPGRTERSINRFHPLVRVRLLTAAEEEKLNAALRLYGSGLLGHNKRHAYRRYWLGCHCDGLAHIGLRAFYRRMQRIDQALSTASETVLLDRTSSQSDQPSYR